MRMAIGDRIKFPNWIHRETEKLGDRKIGKLKTQGLEFHTPTERRRLKAGLSPIDRSTRNHLHAIIYTQNI